MMFEEREPAGEGFAQETASAAKRRSRIREMEEHLAQMEARAAALEAALAQKQQEMEIREKEAREFLEGWQRERANFENYRKRMARELDDAGLVAKADLIRSILPAIDNLERAIEDASGDVEVLRKGVQMTYDQLLSGLQQQGLKVVPTTGVVFDPNLHEAVDSVPGTEHPPDTIVEDLQKGYTLGDRLVRPARVRVAR